MTLLHSPSRGAMEERKCLGPNAARDNCTAAERMERRVTLVVDVPDCEAAHIVDVVARIGGDRDRDFRHGEFL